jgi:hypothetical protein
MTEATSSGEGAGRQAGKMSHTPPHETFGDSLGPALQGLSVIPNA